MEAYKATQVLETICKYQPAIQRDYHVRRDLTREERKRLIKNIKMITGVSYVDEIPGDPYSYYVRKGMNFADSEVFPKVIRIIKNHVGGE